MRPTGLGLLCALLVAPATPWMASPGGAATFTVDALADDLDPLPGDGLCAAAAGCTLRAAIAEANALAGADTITLPAGTLLLKLGRLAVSGELTITGAGEAETVIRGSGGRVSGFDIAAGAVVTITDCTISKHFAGRDNQPGGGIANAGTLALTRVTLSKNRTHFANGAGLLNTGTATLTRVTLAKNRAHSGGGGGIANRGTLTLVDSTLSQNRAGGAGGLDNGGTATLVNVTLTRNQAWYGGGIENTGHLSLVNTTLQRNRAKQDGGALRHKPGFGGSVLLTNATVADNLARTGAAFASGNGGVPSPFNVTLRNTLVVGRRNCAEPVVSLGHNLDSDTSCGLGGPGDLSATALRLGPPADHGGATPTIALPADSPAVDAGDDAACPATDQRGLPRPQGTACDIGAYELQP